MRIVSTISGLFLILAALVGCAPTQGPPEQDASLDAQAIRAQFDRIISAFVGEDDPERAADVYLAAHTEDAVLMFPGGPAIEGHAAIRPFIVEFATAYEFSFPEWNSHELVVSGDLAFHRFSGVGVMVPREGGDTIRDNRKYLDIWMKGDDGEWRIARHIFNANQ